MSGGLGAPAALPFPVTPLGTPITGRKHLPSGNQKRLTVSWRRRGFRDLDFLCGDSVKPNDLSCPAIKAVRGAHIALSPGRHAYDLVTGQPRGNSKKQDRDNQDDSFPSHFHRMCFSEERYELRVKSSSHLRPRMLVCFDHVVRLVVDAVLKFVLLAVMAAFVAYSPDYPILSRIIRRMKPRV
jgi:hypothetical protein